MIIIVLAHLPLNKQKRPVLFLAAERKFVCSRFFVRDSTARDSVREIRFAWDHFRSRADRLFEFAWSHGRRRERFDLCVRPVAIPISHANTWRRITRFNARFIMLHETMSRARRACPGMSSWAPFGALQSASLGAKCCFCKRQKDCSQNKSVSAHYGLSNWQKKVKKIIPKSAFKFVFKLVGCSRRSVQVNRGTNKDPNEFRLPSRSR